VKSCITYHLIASLHLNHEGRYILLFTVDSICDDIYYVVVQLQSCILKRCLINCDLNNLLKQFAC
jgi:hypothetical protein